MRPSPIHYLVAHSFAITGWGAAGVFVLVIIHYLFPAVLILGWKSWLPYVVTAVVAAVPLGWMLGCLFLWPFVSALGGRINGTPFREGDSVYILKGPHRGRVARVHAVWTSRGQVHVKAPVGETEKVDDYLRYTEVCKAPSGSPPQG